LWYRPPTFKQFSICLISAFARVSGAIRNLFERFSKALAVFLSLVFCEMIVAINVAKGLRVAVVHVGIANVVRSILRIVSARWSAIAEPHDLKVINSECSKLLISNGEGRLERARVFKEEITEQDTRFLAVYVEAKNSCLVMLSEREDKLGTLAIAVPRPKDLLGPPSSSVLLGDKNAISARMFAEHLAARKEKIALVSVYLETMDETQAQSVFKRLIEKVAHEQPQKEASGA
jgi:hypothetical protein